MSLNGPYFKSPYHIHLLINFNGFSFNMHVKKSSNWAFTHLILITSLTTFNPSFKQ